MDLIFLHSLPRSGTTLTMGLLGTAPSIVFERKYPYEQLLATYVTRAAQTMTLLPSERDKREETIQYIRAWNNKQIAAKNRVSMGPLPYKDATTFVRLRLRRRLFRALWQALSKELAVVHAAKHPGQEPRYYAEWALDDVATEFERSTNVTVKRIYLYRDPRDRFVSIQRFNAKRGHLAFHWEEGMSNMDYARQQIKLEREALDQHLAAMRTEGSLCLRYEDLVAGPEPTAKLAAFLGVELHPDAVPPHEQHATSDSPAGSVNRWKRELDPEVAAYLGSELGEQLRALGYDVP